MGRLRIQRDLRLSGDRGKGEESVGDSRKESEADSQTGAKSALVRPTSISANSAVSTGSASSSRPAKSPRSTLSSKARGTEKIGSGQPTFQWGRAGKGPNGFPYVVSRNEEIVAWLRWSVDSEFLAWALSFQDLLGEKKNQEFLDLFFDYLSRFRNGDLPDA